MYAAGGAILTVDRCKHGTRLSFDGGGQEVPRVEMSPDTGDIKLCYITQFTEAPRRLPLKKTRNLCHLLGASVLHTFTPL